MPWVVSQTRIHAHIIMPSRVCYCQDGDRKSGSVSVRGGWEMRMLWMESSCTLTHTPLRWQMSDFQRAVKLSLSPLYALVHFALSCRLSNRALPRRLTHTNTVAEVFYMFLFLLRFHGWFIHDFGQSFVTCLKPLSRS